MLYYDYNKERPALYYLDWMTNVYARRSTSFKGLGILRMLKAGLRSKAMLR